MFRPAFWGLINPEWSLCNKGRRQSPVNLEPQRLLFDPNLRQLHIDKHRISGLIANTGHSVIFTAGNDTVANYDGMQTPVNITGGPFSYRYRFHEIHIHYGLHDQFGSEHSVDGYTFPAEVISILYLTERFSPALAIFRMEFCAGIVWKVKRLDQTIKSGYFIRDYG
uniref:Alpha-carbonic anhydrase domain-containing protein n=1 Tax=Glossina austeni TaxID=7395 RepID=A0A1A9UED3_GLOAU